MIKIYANLIIAGKKTINEVPMKLRMAVELMVQQLLS